MPVMEGARAHRKSAVCNFCSPPSNYISTAVTKAAVLKRKKDQFETEAKIYLNIHTKHDTKHLIRENYT